MTPRKTMSYLAAACSLALILGCQQPAGDMMAEGPPPRPAELDQLNDWAGTWNGTGEMIMHTPKGEQKMTTTGKETAKWVCDNRVLMSEMEYDMGDMGKMTGISIATYDKNSKKFRSYWFDSMGTVGHGEMWKDPSTGMWMMKTKGTDPMSGDATSGKGTVKMLDPNTMEWTFTEYDGWGFNKKVEMKGTSRKM